MKFFPPPPNVCFFTIFASSHNDGLDKMEDRKEERHQGVAIKNLLGFSNFFFLKSTYFQTYCVYFFQNLWSLPRQLSLVPPS